jgi:hypothetical protein
MHHQRDLTACTDRLGAVPERDVVELVGDALAAVARRGLARLKVAVRNVLTRPPI